MVWCDDPAEVLLGKRHPAFCAVEQTREGVLDGSTVEQLRGVLPDGPAFTRARTEGWLLSICRGGRPRRALAGSDPSRKAQDGRVDAVAIDKGHLGDRFWGQVPGFSGRFKAGWGRDRRAAERLNLRARALYENESAARFRDPEISMVSRGSNSTTPLARRIAIRRGSTEGSTT